MNKNWSREIIAMVPAAGFGTRLKPWTDTNPKALYPIEGIPMLQRVFEKLYSSGINEIIVNIHHFGDKIIEFVNTRNFEFHVKISDERDNLLDTGGGLLKVMEDKKRNLIKNGFAVLVHNADILSNADLKSLIDSHLSSKNDATLLVSNRNSNRKLLFDESMNLKGWTDIEKDLFRPSYVSNFRNLKSFAFSGIYIINGETSDEMIEIMPDYKFPIMDYLLSEKRIKRVGGYVQENLELLDIGKPAILSQASDILRRINSNVNGNPLSFFDSQQLSEK